MSDRITGFLLLWHPCNERPVGRSASDWNPEPSPRLGCGIRSNCLPRLKLLTQEQEDLWACQVPLFWLAQCAWVCGLFRPASPHHHSLTSLWVESLRQCSNLGQQQRWRPLSRRKGPLCLELGPTAQCFCLWIVSPAQSSQWQWFLLSPSIKTHRQGRILRTLSKTPKTGYLQGCTIYLLFSYHTLFH